MERLDIEISQVVSDLCGGIRACARELGAEHISDLFHAQQEVNKATSASLASQERGAQKILDKAEGKLKKMRLRPRWMEKEKKKQQENEIKEEVKIRDHLKNELEIKKRRREITKEAIKELGDIVHPIDLKTGKLQTAMTVENRFNEQFNVIQKCAQEAQLSEPGLDHIEKAKRAFSAIGRYFEYFFLVFVAFIEGLSLNTEQESFFKETIFPLSYLQVIWRRLPKKTKGKYGQVLQSLGAKIRDGPWPEELKKAWMKSGMELAKMFQRSSSCVEGRNGALSLNHHRFHRLNPRSLQVLTIVHNFDVRRQDGTTAAERFFEKSHESLFNFLAAHVRIPARPQKQKHTRGVQNAA